MSRFWGKIGLNRGYVETAPGVHETKIEEIEVSGEMRGIGARWSNANQRDGISVRHALSIIVPEDSVIDYTEAVYVIWQGRKWSIKSIEYLRPRVNLSLGELYNG